MPGALGNERPGVGAVDFAGEGGFPVLAGSSGFGLCGAAFCGDFTGESLGGREGGPPSSDSSTGDTDLTVLTLALEDKESLLEVRLILFWEGEFGDRFTSSPLRNRAFSLDFKGSLRFPGFGLEVSSCPNW